MSFHSELTADGVWPADIRTALGWTTETPVYVGLRPRSIPRVGGEVWIERLPVSEESSGGFDRLAAYPYRLHVRVKGQPGPKRTNFKKLIQRFFNQTFIMVWYIGTTYLMLWSGICLIIK